MSDPKEIVNTLNEYFASVGPNIAERIKAVQGDIPDDVSNDAVRNDDSFHFDNVEPDYVMDLLNSMHENKATGTDEIPVKLLKISAEEIVLPLMYLVNLYLTTGTFPSQWKKARICPIFKEGDSTEPCNYRPISILPVLSKVIERAVFDQMYPFLDGKAMIHDNQLGFRPNYSTSSALLHITEEWLNAIDESKYNIGIVMLDLEKKLSIQSTTVSF